MYILTTKQAAEELGITERRIRALCQAGRMGTKIGSQWAISPADLERCRHRPPGRPKAKKRKKKGV